MSTTELHRDFLGNAETKLGKYMAQIGRCAGLLSGEQLWTRANEHCNSVGNLLLHLNGNVRQWIVSGLGGAPLDRERPAEFSEEGPLPAERVLGDLAETIRSAREVIKRLDDASLARRYEIQRREVTGLIAVFHAVEHFAFHTGQIIQITKELCAVDLSLYDEQGRPLPSNPDAT